MFKFSHFRLNTAFKYSLLLISFINTACIAQAPSLEPQENKEVTAIFEYLKKTPGEFNLPEPGKELLLVENKTDPLGFHHYKFQQQHHNVPVWAKELLVHVNAKGDIYRVAGKLAPDLNHIDIQPNFDHTEAKTRIETLSKTTKISDPILHILAENTAHLVYISETWQNMQRMYYVIDAHSGELLTTLAGVHYNMGISSDKN